MWLSFAHFDAGTQIHKTNIVFLPRLIHLTSKDASVSGESLALTTTSAFLRMFEVLWLEFKLKDGRPVCLWNRMRLAIVFLPLILRTLPSPSKKFELAEVEVLLLSVSLAFFRASNFVLVFPDVESWWSTGRYFCLDATQFSPAVKWIT